MKTKQSPVLNQIIYHRYLIIIKNLYFPKEAKQSKISTNTSSKIVLAL